MNNPTQADIVESENSGAAASESAPVSTTFPQEINIPLTLTIRVNSQEDRDMYLIPGTNKVHIGVLADVFDNFLSYSVEELLNVNGVPYEEIKRQLAQAKGWIV
jgi:imidazole glycerol phosphate synthase subunit HisF